jgi:hypothetical protein
MGSGPDWTLGALGGAELKEFKGAVIHPLSSEMSRYIFRKL